jgi:hypothetical protein
MDWPTRATSRCRWRRLRSCPAASRCCTSSRGSCSPRRSPSPPSTSSPGTATTRPTSESVARLQMICTCNCTSPLAWHLPVAGRETGLVGCHSAAGTAVDGGVQSTTRQLLGAILHVRSCVRHQSCAVTQVRPGQVQPSQCRGVRPPGPQHLHGAHLPLSPAR